MQGERGREGAHRLQCQTTNTNTPPTAAPEQRRLLLPTCGRESEGRPCLCIVQLGKMHRFRHATSKCPALPQCTSAGLHPPRARPKLAASMSLNPSQIGLSTSFQVPRDITRAGKIVALERFGQRGVSESNFSFREAVQGIFC